MDLIVESEILAFRSEQPHEGQHITLAVQNSFCLPESQHLCC